MIVEGGEPLRTWREWDAERIHGIMIVDADGFLWDDLPMTRAEFLKQRDFCTLSMGGSDRG